MAESQDPKNKQTGGAPIPSPPLPQVPSPAIPDIKGKSAKSTPASKPSTPQPDSFHFVDPELEAKAKQKTQAAPQSQTAQSTAPTQAKAASPKTTTSSTDKPRPFSPAAVPHPKTTPAKLASHAGGTPGAAPTKNPQLDQTLEQRPLSIEEKEKLHGTGPATGWNKFLEFLQPIVVWLIKITTFLTAASLAFLLLNLFRGNLAPTSPLAHSKDLLHLINIAALVLEVSLVILAASVLISCFDTSAVAFCILGSGLLLHFGVPLLLFNQIGRSEATALIAMPLRQAGIILIALGMIKYAFDVILWIRTLPERMQARADIGVAQQAEAAQRRTASNANAFSPCWQLPFCREVIRKQCPAYLARKTCWKFGRGCYCDEEMISRIIRGESLTIIKAPTRMSRKGKPPCGRCYIYLEHQSHKFRMLSPLAVPVTVLVVYLLWPTYTNVFKGFSGYLDKFWALLSFNPRKMATGVLDTSASNYNNMSTLSPDQVTHVALVIFGVLLGFMLLIYLSKFIEWAIYKAKW